MTLRIFIATIFSCAFLAANGMNDPVEPQVKSANNSKLVLKTDREFVGGTVALYSSTGQLLVSQKLAKRRVIIDFSMAPFGAYDVVVAKSNVKRTINYMKK
jgi:hypothetical protein